MNRFFPMSLCGAATVTTLFVLHPTLADEDNLSTDQLKNSARMNCGARIECVTPDGHTGQVSKLPVQDPSATALIMDDDTVTCLLQEGETNFVIELPHSAVPDRFTFLNENTGARGELKIAVSNRRLRADSPEWTEVEGIVPFAHKRLFGVSLLGIEARFVRLSFHVEKEGRIAAIAADGQKRCDEGTEQHNASVQVPQGFQNSSLDDALNSKFAALYSQGSRLLLTANLASVAPLPPMSSD